MNHTSITAFPDYATNPTPNFEDPGTKVFSSKKGGTDNGVEVTDLAPYTLTFDTPFEWDGTSNILVTVFDSTGVKSGYKTTHHMIQTTEVPRFLHQRTAESSYANAGWSMSNLTAAKAVSQNDRGYVNKITFTFAAAALPPATPSDLTVSSVGANIATLSWSAVEGATAYDLEQSTDNENWSTLASNVSGTSFEWTGLSAASTQYARISAKNANGSSAPSSAVTVATDAIHSHDGITFDKWNSTDALPTSGDYYLANDIVINKGNSDITLTDNLRLCLNGKTVTIISNSSIIVPDEKTLTVYDNVGGGSISGYYETSSMTPNSGLITVNGTLILHEGAVQNLNVEPNSGNIAYAIYNFGTLRIAGNPVITAATADISLFTSKYITLDGELTNTSKYRVNAVGQTITSGWNTHMSGEKPSDYFVSAKSGYRGICVVDNEARIVKLLALDEEDDNDDISDGTYAGTICVNMTRSVLTSASFNTICLPFALSNAELQEIFGAGYDLREFESSSLDGEVLSLTFSDPLDALEAGKPYLIQPAIDVTNPSFEGVTITAISPINVETSYVDFKGNYAPTELQGGNKNFLFLGADDELFWPAADGNIKGFRAYFEVKGAAQQAVRARIIKGEEADQAIDQTSQEPIANSQKLIMDGQLLIERNGKIYNAQGQLIK